MMHQELPPLSEILAEEQRMLEALRSFTESSSKLRLRSTGRDQQGFEDSGDEPSQWKDDGALYVNLYVNVVGLGLSANQLRNWISSVSHEELARKFFANTSTAPVGTDIGYR
jgi:hypothetical protein